MDPIPPQAAESAVRLKLRDAGVLAVLCGAIFLEGLDIAMLNVALPAIRAELGLSTTILSAVVTSYVIGYAGFMLLGGRVCDLYGRKRVFLVSLGIFASLSGAGGFATEGWVLLTARFVTGIAAAFMTPAGLSLITTSFPEGPRRNKAVLIYAGAASAGYSLGLLAGGALTAISWRLVFFAPAVLALLILVAGRRLVVDRGRPMAGPFDLIGAVVLTTAMLLAAFAVVRLEQMEHLPEVLAAGAASAGLWLLLVTIERSRTYPMIRFGIFRSGALVRANLAMLLLGGSFFGFQFVVTIFLQEVLGWSPLETGLAILAVSIDAILAPTLAPRLVGRFGTGRVIAAGLGLACLAYALFLRIDLSWGYGAMLPTMLLLGLGFALAYGPLTLLATNGIDEAEQGLASGLVNTAFQFGAGLGLSAVAAMAVADVGSGRSSLEVLRVAMLVPVTAAAAATLIMLASPIRRGRWSPR
jgi:MFS family permease